MLSSNELHSTMELLDLPAELFKQVIRVLVRDEGVARAFKYRLTCSLYFFFVTMTTVSDFSVDRNFCIRNL